MQTSKRTTAPQDPLTSLATKARQFPMLSAQDEIDLISRWREHDDAMALQQLLGSHLRLVIKMAWKYSGYGLPVADLVAEGNVGLMQAAERFDPERGFRFATYAQWWVRAAMQDYVMRSISIIRMGTTATQKKLFFNLRRLKNSLDIYGEGDLAPDVVSQIAAELDVPEEAVIEMNRRLSSADASLNVSIGEDGDTTWQDALADEDDDPEAALVHYDEFTKRWDLIEAGLKQLKPRERDILRQRKLRDEPKTLEELSQVYGISRERVRQIEANAFKKLQRAVTDAADDRGITGTRTREADSDELAMA